MDCQSSFKCPLKSESGMWTEDYRTWIYSHNRSWTQQCQAEIACHACWTFTVSNNKYNQGISFQSSGNDRPKVEPLPNMSYSLSRILYCQFCREFICPLFIKGPIRFNGDKSTPTHCLPRTNAQMPVVGGVHCPWTRADVISYITCWCRWRCVAMRCDAFQSVARSPTQWNQTRGWCTNPSHPIHLLTLCDNIIQ